MLRSLNTGVSGLRAHQQMLDVTGNNIANVNTTGFKGSRTEFQDTLSQLIAAGVAPDQQAGGRNPAQIGLGVQVATVSTNFTQGAAELTGRATDMMINGDGFFVVQRGGQDFYTRDGSFTLDAEGRLSTANGDLVQGWTAQDGAVNAGGATGPITIPVGDVVEPAATTEVTFDGNLPSDAEDGTEMFRDVEVFDELGNSSTITLTFTAGGGSWAVAATDGDGNPLGATTLAFTDGELAPGTTLALGGAGAPTVDLSAVTGYGDLSNLTMTGKDGRAAGELTSFSVAPDGSVMGTYTNGDIRAIGRIALATFDNAGGLEKAGNSLYAATGASGEALVGVGGQGAMGTITSGALEMSNVDLSQEFTDLIVAQRGFQANSRVVTTSDELLNEIMSLKR